MRIPHSSRPWRGSTLVTTLVLAGVMAISVAGLLRLVSYRSRAEFDRLNWNDCYYQAENALQWAGQTIADASQGGSSAPFLGQYSVGNGNLAVDYMGSLPSNPNSLFRNAWVTIQNHPSGVINLYRVTASAKVKDKVRTLRATIRKNPPSQVFDYEYFLNNWGWWWGSSITGNGDNRANWDFDFRYSPKVNGNVMANGHIESNGQAVDPLVSVPFTGTAGSDPVAYVHAGVPRVTMPNLKDFTYYEQKAAKDGGKIVIDGKTIVTAVHSSSSKPGLYLEGTATKPIQIQGSVVIPGDVIIKGVVTGIGTLYVGGNLYFASNVTYLNGPSFSSAPETMSKVNRDNWVGDATSAKKDLIAFAVRESVFGGDVTSSDWKSTVHDPAGYGLKNVGDESKLGEDGITGTPDDNISYRDTNGDGSPDTPWNDVDGDGVKDANYNYSNDIEMHQNRASKVTGYPLGSDGKPVAYGKVANNSMNRIDGVVYCNHAVGLRLARSDTIWNGAVICHDEAIIFSGSLRFNYDSRIHSRYSDDPNRFIDLGLPVANKVRLEFVEEIKPLEGYATAP